MTAHMFGGFTDEALTFGKLSEDKALGVKWNIRKDTLGFRTKMAANPSTSRGLLSMLSSIYNPLGLGAPFLLKGRLIIQQLCRDRLSWDEPLVENSSYEWLKWKNTLVAMQNINIPRFYKPTDFGQIVEYTLHHFSDASETGYGQASYLRMTNENGDVHCCLIFGESIVALVKYVSIPRTDCCHPLSKSIIHVKKRVGHSSCIRRVLDRQSRCSELHK